MIRSFVSGVATGTLLFLGGWVLVATWRIAGELVTARDNIRVFLGFALYSFIICIPLSLLASAIKRAHLKEMGAKRKDDDHEDGPPPPDPNAAA